MTFLTERPITWRAKETTKETRISFPLVHSSFTVTSDNQTQTYWYNSLLFPFPWGFFLRYIAIMCIVYLLAVYEWKALKATLPYARCRPLQTLPYPAIHCRPLSYFVMHFIHSHTVIQYTVIRCYTLSYTYHTLVIHCHTLHRLSYVVIHCHTLIIHLSYIVIHFIDSCIVIHCHTLDTLSCTVMHCHTLAIHLPYTSYTVIHCHTYTLGYIAIRCHTLSNTVMHCHASSSTVVHCCRTLWWTAAIHCRTANVITPKQLDQPYIDHRPITVPMPCIRPRT